MNLVTLEYLKDSNTLALFLRNGRERELRIVKDFRPYFYSFATGETNNRLTIDGFKVSQIFTKFPQDVLQEVKNYTKVWEDHVKFTTRYLVDEVPTLDKVELRVQYTDIETDIVSGRIMSISAYDNYLEKCVVFVWREDLVPTKYDKEYSFPSGYKFKASIRTHLSLKGMLQDYIKFIQKTDPDILTGWYSTGYDFPQIIKQINGCGLDAKNLSPIHKAYVIGDTVNKLESNIRISGRVLFDMLKSYKALSPTRLRDASLEAVSQIELKEGKHAHRAFKDLWKNIDELVEYNAKDCVLVYRIDQKKKLLTYFDTLRRFSHCEWGSLYHETSVWDAYILHKLHNKLVLPTKKRTPADKFKGAKVLQPFSKGIHRNVILIDLKGLYPSIIITFNMSPETLAENVEYVDKLCRLPNGVSFRKDKVGLLPEILLEMLELRNSYKKEMDKYAFGTPEYEAWYMQQEAIKVMMNALYGAMKYENFRLVTPKIAESVAYVGRNIIEFVIKTVESMGYKILYGDSVLPDEPVIIKNKMGFIDIKPIEEVSVGEYVWSDKGFTKILNKIKKPLTKQIYTINSRRGLVHATEDHSLLLDDDTEISPKNITLETKLMHRSLPKNDLTISNDMLDLYWVYGLFAAEGHSQYYPKNQKSNWKISMQNTAALEKAGKILKKYFQVEYKVVLYPSSKDGVYDLKVLNFPYGDLKAWVLYWRNLFYDSFGKKRIPIDVLNSNNKMKIEFLRGYDIGDGYTEASYKFEFQDFTTNSKTLAAGLCYLLNCLNRDYNLMIRKDKPNIIGIGIRSPSNRGVNHWRRTQNWQLKTVKPEFTEFDRVYDLETENHHFGCGVGELIVHNTDSVFVYAQSDDTAVCVEQMKSICDRINSDVPLFIKQFGNSDNCTIHIDPKKVYKAFMMSEKKSGKGVAKKCYAGLIGWAKGEYIDLSSEKALEVMGYSSKRSDSSELSRDVQRKVIRMLLEGCTKQNLKVYIEEINKKLMNGELELEYVGIPKGLSQSLESYKTDNPHRRGAIYSNKYLGKSYGIGDKPRIIWLASTGKYPRTDVVAFNNNEDVPKDFKMDINLMIEKSIIQKIEHILDSANLSLDEILHETTKLECFM